MTGHQRLLGHTGARELDQTITFLEPPEFKQGLSSLGWNYYLIKQYKPVFDHVIPNSSKAHKKVHGLWAFPGQG
jgi:hypothetical protein